jgi:hypothetical protein
LSNSTENTAIARAVAEKMSGKLGASFFCSRQSSDRGEIRLIAPTLALQLAHNFPDFLEWIRGSDLGRFCAAGQERTAIQILIAEPSRKSETSTVIIIDALEKCKRSDSGDPMKDSKFLSALKENLGRMPGIKFLITAPCDESYMRRAFRSFGSDLVAMHRS